MYVLVINCGSSSIKADLLDPATGARKGSVRAERVGTDGAFLRVDDGEVETLGHADHTAALAAFLPRLAARVPTIDAVGHRVVHGGERFTRPTRIDADVEDAIDKLSTLAPLHNPPNLQGIRAARALLPDVPHVAVFDTAFHSTLPRRAQAYALPHALVAEYGIRRYGFHGTSHGWVAQRAAEWLGEDVRDLRLITCHLGNGCSVAAVEYGRSVETSMGMTPVEGLVMGTRAGDVDAGVLIDLMRRARLDADGLDHLLNRESGLKGLSGVGNDLRDIEARAADGDDRCRQALNVFCHRVRKYIGAYAAVMGGVDAIVFTGGIGQHSAHVRHRVAQRLEFLGAHLDEDRNRDAVVDGQNPVYAVSPPHGRTALLVVATDEEHAIAKATGDLCLERDLVAGADLTIPVAISARHIHLTQEAVETLFGPGHRLTPLKPLSQPGQFACEETLTVVGPKRSLERVRVLGPTRPACQVEVSRTDEYHLGIDAPVRDSGDVANTPGVTLMGPQGALTLQEGIICARRHIHMTPADAARFGVKNRDVVEVAVDSEGRDLVFGDVLVRVKDSYALEMHIDTDEANAAEIEPGHQGVLEGTGRVARLRHRRTHFDPH